ncbi:MAG TPA: hypothetical protein VLF79_02385 [Candidatus Saccharimonadales bacterium]|nr:hypothetical protein [Candidatus Saccharimonadales bacterium]
MSNQKIIKIIRRSFFYLVVGLVSFCGSLLAPVLAMADSANINAALPRSYNADASVLSGMLVELNPKDQSSVIPVSTHDAGNLLGVVLPNGGAPISITPKPAQQQQVVVATSGLYSMMVSNQNGAIKSGDYLTISSIDGIAMRAAIDQTQIVGRASAGFNGNSNVIGTQALKSGQSKSSNISIGLVPVNVKLAPNPLNVKNAKNIPQFIGGVANSLANKPVSSPRLYLSLAVFVAAVLTTFTIIYSGVRNSVLAIGRNPLARFAIARGLIETVSVGLIIFAVGVFAVYLILRI